MRLLHALGIRFHLFLDGNADFLKIFHLCPNIAREIRVRLNISIRLIVENLLELQFSNQVGCGLLRQFCHIGEIDTALLLHGDCQSVNGTVRLCRHTLRDDRALRENIRLADKILLAVINFIRCDKVAAGINTKHLFECLILCNAPVSLHMILIEL